jgi:hypothetical protein
MGRSVALVGVLMLLIVRSGAGWVATRPPLARFVVPGATDIQVTTLRWNEWQVRYHAPGTPTTWYADVGRMLEAHHWISPDQATYAPLNRSYSRAVSLGFCDLWEWVYLTFDPLRPASAQIRVRRW